MNSTIFILKSSIIRYHIDSRGRNQASLRENTPYLMDFFKVPSLSLILRYAIILRFFFLKKKYDEF